MKVRKATQKDLNTLMELFEIAKQYMVAHYSIIIFSRTLFY